MTSLSWVLCLCSARCITSLTRALRSSLVQFFGLFGLESELDPSFFFLLFTEPRLRPVWTALQQFCAVTGPVMTSCRLVRTGYLLYKLIHIIQCIMYILKEKIKPLRKWSLWLICIVLVLSWWVVEKREERTCLMSSCAWPVLNWFSSDLPLRKWSLQLVCIILVGYCQTWWWCKTSWHWCASEVMSCALRNYKNQVDR